MTDNRTIVYQSFEKGDFGRAAPAFNIDGGFRGLNSFVYPNGAIGPRPPFVQIPVTGLPTLQIRHMIYNAAQAVMVVIFTNRAVYKFNPVTGGAATLIGTIATAVDDVTSSGNIIYGCRLAATGTGGVLINLASSTISNLASMPNGQFIRVYGPQWIVVGGANANRIHYSALGDATSWPGDFTDVGDLTPITGVFLQRNAISVVKSGGEWWAVTGVLGAETVRRSEKGLDYISPGVVTAADNVWWVNGRDMGTFSGAQVRSELRPDVPYTNEVTIGGNPPDEELPEDAAPLASGDDLIVVGVSESSEASGYYFGYAHVRTNGVWTRHVLPLAAVTELPGTILFVEPTASGVPVVAYRGTASDAPSFYRWDARTEFPLGPTVIDGDTAYFTTGSSGEFSTPEFWPEEGDLVHVRRVIVDFSYRGADVLLAVGVRALNRSADGEVESTEQEWTPSSNEQTHDTFVRRRVVMSFGDQGDGGGAVVDIALAHSIMVHRVIMEVQLIPASDL
jgi:hypothetical protein